MRVDAIFNDFFQKIVTISKTRPLQPKKLQRRDYHVPPNMIKYLLFFFVAGAGGRQARARPWINIAVSGCLQIKNEKKRAGFAIRCHIARNRQRFRG